MWCEARHKYQFIEQNTNEKKKTKRLYRRKIKCRWSVCRLKSYLQFAIYMLALFSCHGTVIAKFALCLSFSYYVNANINEHQKATAIVCTKTLTTLSHRLREKDRKKACSLARPKSTFDSTRIQKRRQFFFSLLSFFFIYFLFFSYTGCYHTVEQSAVRQRQEQNHSQSRIICMCREKKYAYIFFVFYFW